VKLTAARIQQLLHLLNSELSKEGVKGELHLAGGAVMCLVYRAREATKDVDALFVPASALRAAAEIVAKREGLEPGWLNDAVKGFFSEAGRFEVYEEMTNLKVYAPSPDYLLAMKCLAMRLGEEFEDRNDVAMLLKVLKLKTPAEAESLLALYYPLEGYPVRSRYIIEELLQAS
jgi:hypothetical protein